MVVVRVGCLLAFATLAAAVACGGATTRDETGASAGGQDASSGGSASFAGDGGSALGGAAQLAGNTSVGGVYVPDRKDVPPKGDGRLSGSFETTAGFGWDSCYTKNPGATHVGATRTPRASDGTEYVRFDSGAECTSPSSSPLADVQLAFWLDTPLPANVPLHLYFDAIDLGDTASGTLQLDQVDANCATIAPLATLKLPDLELTSAWQTRCVTFTPSSDVHVFGLYVWGAAFHVGLDAFRLGPPCHAS